MKFYLAKTLNGIGKYGDIFDLSNESNEKVESFEIEEDDFALLEEYFIDSINDKCNSLLEYGDYDFFDVDKCKILKNWLEENIANNSVKRLDELYNKLLEYTNKAIQYNTGLAIDF